MTIQNSFKKLFLFISLLLLLINSVQAESIQVEDTNIQIVTPVGYTRVTPASDPEQFSLFKERSVTELLAVFNKVNIDEDWDEDITINISSELKRVNANTKDFQQIKHYMSKNYHSLIKNVPTSSLFEEKINALEEKISNNYDTGITINMPKITYLGSFVDLPDVWSGMQYVRGAFKSEGAVVPFNRINTISLLLLKNKILFVYINANYESENDISELQDFTSQYTRKLILNNSYSND